MHLHDRVESLRVRQRQVEQDQVIIDLRQLFPRFRQPQRVIELEPLFSGALQRFPQQPRVAGVVLNEQNVSRTQVHFSYTPTAWACGSFTSAAQKSPTRRTTSMKASSSTGLVT